MILKHIFFFPILAIQHLRLTTNIFKLIWPGFSQAKKTSPETGQFRFSERTQKHFSIYNAEITDFLKTCNTDALS